MCIITSETVRMCFEFEIECLCILCVCFLQERQYLGESATVNKTSLGLCVNSVSVT